jgi:tetratricopeptide (TPR) repeat protein
LLERARSSERVIPYLVESYAQAIAGHWEAAFSRAREGLREDSQNGYLRRRAAYYLMRQGHFNDAAQHARRAVEIADDIVADRCLLGDALLGQGQIIHALQQYADAARHNPEHPLPAYHQGYALILVGTLLEREIFDRLASRNDVQTSDIDPNLTPNPAQVDPDTRQFEYELKLIRERRQILGEAATAAFERAQVHFAHPEYESSRRVSYLDQQVSTQIGLYRGAWMGSDQPSVPAVSSAVSAFHYSDYLHRELLLANMWEHHMAQMFWNAVLNTSIWSGVLNQLGLLPRTAG